MLPDPDLGKIRFNGINAQDVLYEIYRRREAVKHLTSFRRLLKDRHRMIFDLHFNDFLTNEQIAKMLGLSRVIVRNHLKTAIHLIIRHAIREWIRQQSGR